MGPYYRPPAPLRTATTLPFTFLLALPLLLQVGCGSTREPPSFAPQVQEISTEAAGDNFKLLSTDRSVYVIYPDLSALSLNLVRLSLPPSGAQPVDQATNQAAEATDDGRTDGTRRSDQDSAPAPLVLQTTFLDRISETPEIGERFGTAALAPRGGLLNVFYSDREREGTPVLKWVSGPTAENKWWIDILPYPGEPLAVLPVGEDDLELYLLRTDALVRQSLLTGETQELLNPCDPAPEVCVVKDRQRDGITVFDRGSQRLYAFLHGNGTESTQVVYTAGAAHYALLRDSRLRVLLFSPSDATLLLLEERPGAGSSTYTATPVTLCEGTTSVFLGYAGGNPYFLYNERAMNHDGTRGGYLLTLLTPRVEQGGEMSYHRTELLDLPTPLRRFSVNAAGSLLYVFFVQDTLKMLTLDLGSFSSE